MGKLYTALGVPKADINTCVPHGSGQGIISGARVLPTLGNNLVIVKKDTSTATVIGAWAKYVHVFLATVNSIGRML